QAVWSGADRPHGEVTLEVAYAVDMLRKHEEVVELSELGGKALFESDDDRVLVDDLRGTQIELLEPAGDLRRFGRRIDDLAQREQYIARAHRRAVGECRRRVEMERVALSVVADLPLLRESRDHLQVRIEVNHRGEEVERDVPIPARGGENRI